MTSWANWPARCFAAERILKPGGRLVVVSFHSLEDRIVKRFIADRSEAPAGSRHMPVLAAPDATFDKLGGIVACSDAEADRNPRARSAKVAGRATNFRAGPRRRHFPFSACPSSPIRLGPRKGRPACFRTTDLLLIAVMISAAAFTYKTKHDAENRYTEIRRLESQIRVQENAVDVVARRLEPPDPALATAAACRALRGRFGTGHDRGEAIRPHRRGPDARIRHRGHFGRIGREFCRKRCGPGEGSSNDRALVSRVKRSGGEDKASIVVKGTRQSSAGDARLRIGMTMAVFFVIYAAIGGRLAYLGMQELEASGPPPARVTASRPDIVDRNGEVLATDINTASLFAEPRRIVDVDEAVEKLMTVLPDLDFEMAYRRLSTEAGFVWLRRQLSPRQQQAIMDLGIPGIGFRTEKRRFYPGGPTAAHVLGLVNVDNNGIAGMEKWIDDQGLAELRALGLRRGWQPRTCAAVARSARPAHRARRAGPGDGALTTPSAPVPRSSMPRTGEVVAMVSLPDFDPNNPFQRP